MLGSIGSIAVVTADAVRSVGSILRRPGALLELGQVLGIPGGVLDAELGDDTVEQLDDLIGDAIDGVEAALAAVRGLISDPDADALAVATAIAQLLAALDTAMDAFDALAAQFEDVAQSGGIPGEFLDDLAVQVRDLLIVVGLERTRPVTVEWLDLLGVIERTEVALPDGAPSRREVGFHPQRLAMLLDDPLELVAQRLGWGSSSDPLRLADITLPLAHIGRVLGVPMAVDGVTGELRSPAVRASATDELPTTVVVEPGRDVDELLAPRTVTIATRDDGTTFTLIVEGELPLADGLRIEPPSTIAPVDDSLTVGGRIALEIANGPDDADPGSSEGAAVILLGDVGRSRLQAAAWHITAEVGASTALADLGAGVSGGDLDLRAQVVAAIEDGALVLELADADGFLATFLPDELTFGFEVAARFDEDGLEITGGGGLKVTLPLQLVLGPLTVPKVELELTFDEEGLGFVALAEARIAIGPVSANAAGVGASATLTFNGDDIGPFGLELTFRFRPPQGIGLAVDAGPVQGGGFIGFFPDEGRYTGALSLGIGDIGLTALGLLDTHMPDGSSGFSLLVVIQANFPPITLPFGFALTGVGGLVGINRRLDVDALRDRFASGTVGSILAPEDPVGNATTLFADLSAVFPVTPGVHVVGPTVQLTWSVVVRFDLGIFIELPALTKIVLLGSVRATIGAPGVTPAYAQLRLDVIGVIDLAKGRLEFDAVLIDSHLMQVFELTGGAAFRLWWGDDANVTLAVGGFHPRFDPTPLVFPSSLTRIAMTRGTPQDALYLRLEAYLAVTTNTLHFGAAAEMVLQTSRFKAEGGFAFDALIRFVPFSFDFGLSASLAITVNGRRLASVRFAGTMTGPGPVVVTGELEIEILFVSISFSGTFSFGSDQPPPVETVASALTAFAPALADPRHLQSAGTSGDLQLEVGVLDDEVAVLAPGAGLSWRQEHAPLEVLLDRYQGKPLDTRATLQVFADDDPGAPAVHEPFATGQFVDVDDADALDQPAFDELAAGIGLVTGDAPQGAVVDDVDMAFVEYRLPELSDSDGLWIAMAGWLVASAAGQQPAPKHTETAFRVERAARDVVGQDGAVIAAGLSRTEALQQRRAHPRAVTTVPGDVLAVPAF